VSAGAWLREVSAWCKRIALLVESGVDKLKPADGPAVGGVACVTSMRDRHLCVIWQPNSQFVSLVDISAASGAMTFARDRVVAIRLQ
jgi:hypothetical protein